MEDQRLANLKSVHDDLFLETPTNIKPNTSQDYEEVGPDDNEGFDDSECAVTGFPRCVELTAPNGHVSYRTFDTLCPQMDGKVSEIVVLWTNSRLTGVASCAVMLSASIDK